MIRNQRQFRIAQKRYEELLAAAQAAVGEDRTMYNDLANEVKLEIDDFLSISVGNRDTFEIDSVDGLADALIKARIARGLSQASLAELLGVSEQMVQRDEAGGYERATLVRLADVAEALSYELHGVLSPDSTTGRHARIESSTSTVVVHLHSAYPPFGSVKEGVVRVLSAISEPAPISGNLVMGVIGGGLSLRPTDYERMPQATQSDALVSAYESLESEAGSL